MAFPGGNVAVFNASGIFTDEATQALVDQIAIQITAAFEGFLDPERKRLLNTLPALNDQTQQLNAQMVIQQGQIASIIGELSTVTQQLNDLIPGVEKAQAAASATLE